jgi:hypothetical protein
MSAATEQTTAAAAAPAATCSQALSGGGGVTFVVEDTITPAGPGSYGKTRNYREPSTGHGGSLRAAWESLGGVEAMSPPPTNTVDVFTKQNMLVKAVHTAFFEHHPLILTPDIIWLTIAQVHRSWPAACSRVSVDQRQKHCMPSAICHLHLSLQSSIAMGVAMRSLHPSALSGGH